MVGDPLKSDRDLHRSGVCGHEIFEEILNAKRSALVLAAGDVNFAVIFFNNISRLAERHTVNM